MTIWSVKWCWRFREKAKLPQKFERKRQLSLIDHLTEGEIEELREINAFIERWYNPEGDLVEFGTRFLEFNWLPIRRCEG